MKMIVLLSTLVFLSILYFNMRSIALWTADPFRICEVKDLNYEDGNGLYLKYSIYTNTKESNKKSILVMPPTGGKNILDEGYAIGLCRAGFKVYILEDWKTVEGYMLDYNMHQTYQENTQKSFVKMIELIEGDKIGVFGTSAGGIDISVTMGTKAVSRRVKAFFTIVSGGPLCKVIAHSEEKGLAAIRARRFSETEVSSMEEYEENICAALTWDIPDSLPDTMSYGAIISTNDVTVTSKYQMYMVKNFKPTLLIKSKMNHFYTVVSSYFLYRKRIVNFFKKELL